MELYQLGSSPYISDEPEFKSTQEEYYHEPPSSVRIQVFTSGLLPGTIIYENKS